MSESSLPPENTKPMRAKHISSGPLGVARLLIHLLSGIGQREPPSDKKTQHVRLITIGVSHFCEKARWGLDLLEADSSNPIYYTEDAHPPAFVAFATVPASKDTASQSPMILLEDARTAESRTVFGSNAILRELCPFLYPKDIEDDIVALEANLGQRFGASVRCFVYQNLLQRDFFPACTKICAANTSKIETILFDKMLEKGIEKGIRKVVKVNEHTAHASEGAVRDVFREMSERLERNGGKYLMDTKQKLYGFTAADLTFAALAYPLLRPPEMKNLIPVEDSEIPPVVVKFGDELRATRAGQHAMNMYAHHRGTSRVVLKSVGRDRFAWRSLVYPVAAIGVVAAAVAVARSSSR